MKSPAPTFTIEFFGQTKEIKVPTNGQVIDIEIEKSKRDSSPLAKVLNSIRPNAISYNHVLFVIELQDHYKVLAPGLLGDVDLMEKPLNDPEFKKTLHNFVSFYKWYNEVLLFSRGIGDDSDKGTDSKVESKASA